MFKVNDEYSFKMLCDAFHEEFKGNRIENNILEKYVYIDAYWTDYISTFLPRILYAKGLQDSGNAGNVIALLLEKNKDIDRLFQAFSIDTKFICNRKLLIKSAIKTIFWFLFRNNKDKIYTNLKINGQNVGKYLADTVIRHSDELYSFQKIRIKDLKLVYAFVWRILSIYSLFEKNPPKVFLVHETGYWYGPVIKFAESFGAEIIQCTVNARINKIGKIYNRPINIFDIESYEIKKFLRKVDAEKIEYVDWSDKYFKEVRAGKTSMEAEKAYTKKIILTRNEWQQQVGADPHKKNAVIMAHCFSDDANTGMSRSLYNDYFEWLIETLKIIKKIDNVNWLLKAHPARQLYHEGDGIYDIFRKYSDKPNIFILDDDLNTNALFDIADVVITVGGSCAIEFPVFGIPAICAGFPAFGGYGFLEEPKTVDEYINLLSNIDKMERLSDNKIRLAKKLAYVYLNIHNPIDEFDQIFSDAYQYGLKVGNDYVISGILKFYKNNKCIKDSWFYKMGFDYAD